MLDIYLLGKDTLTPQKYWKHADIRGIEVLKASFLYIPPSIEEWQDKKGFVCCIDIRQYAQQGSFPVDSRDPGVRIHPRERQNDEAWFRVWSMP